MPHSVPRPVFDRLPLELLGEILKFVYWSWFPCPGFASFRLVCRAFADIGRLLLFHQITLHMDDDMRNLSQKHTADFLNIITEDPSIACYVRKLKIRSMNFDDNRDHIKYETAALPQIVMKLRRVDVLKIAETYLPSGPDVRSAMRHLLQLPTLHTLEMIGVTGLPFEALRSCTNLKRLCYRDCEFEDEPEALSVPTKRAVLENIELDTYEQTEIPMLFVGPFAVFDITRLKSMVLKHMLGNGVDALFNECCSSLETLELEYHHGILQSDPPFPSLFKLTKLSSLVFDFTIAFTPELIPLLDSLPSPERLKTITFRIPDKIGTSKTIMQSLSAFDRTLSRFSGTIVLAFPGKPDDRIWNIPLTIPLALESMKLCYAWEC